MIEKFTKKSINYGNSVQWCVESDSKRSIYYSQSEKIINDIVESLNNGGGFNSNNCQTPEFFYNGRTRKIENNVS